MGSSFSNFLLNGQPPPNVTTGTSSTSSLPAWYNSYLSSLASSAVNVASQPYQSYGGTQVAPLDPQQVAGYNYAGNTATDWTQPLQAAQQGAANVAGGFDNSQFQKYLSPYTGGVTDEIQRLGLQNMNENLLPTLNSQFVGSGQFGSDRNGTMDERLVRDVGANISGQQALANQGAFSSAMGNYTQGQGLVNQASNNLGGLAQMQQQGNVATAGELSASGQTMQQQQQAGLDVSYQNWLNQVNYPRQNVSFLAGALQGSNIPTGQDVTSSAPAANYSGSPLATFAGLSLAGLTGNQPTAAAKPPGARAGGYIRLAAGGSPLDAMRVTMPAANSPLMRARRPVAGAGLRGAGGLQHLRMAA